MNYRYLLDEEKNIYEVLLNAIVNFESEVLLDLSSKKYDTNYLYIDDIIVIKKV